MFSKGISRLKNLHNEGMEHGLDVCDSKYEPVNVDQICGACTEEKPSCSGVVHRFQVQTNVSVSADARIELMEENCNHLPNKEISATDDYLKKKVFVGNVGFHVKDRELQDFLSKFGRVHKVHIIKDHFKNRSKGIAFVTFDTAENALKAVSASSDQLEMDGREIRLSHANERRIYKLRKENKERKQQGKILPVQSDETSSTVAIDGLTDDVVMIIFSYLPVADLLTTEKVCRKWKAIAKRVWASKKALRLRGYSLFKEPVLNQDFLKMLLIRCTTLQELDVSCSSHKLGYKAIEIISELCPNLRKCNLTGFELTNVGLKFLAMKCKKIKSFTIHSGTNLSEKGFWWLVHNCQNLQHLDITGNTNIIGKFFYRCSPHLKTLNLTNCNSMQFFDQLYTKLELEELYLAGCPRITDENLKEICLKCVNLKVLHLSSDCVLPRTLVYIAKLEKLTKLDFGFDFIPKRSNELYEFSLDPIIDEISQTCKYLQILNLSFLSSLSISERCFRSLANCHDLQVLHLNYLEITDDALMPISSMENLRQLYLRGCLNIRNKGLKEIVKYCCNLIELDISGSDFVSDEFMDECVKAAVSRIEGPVLKVVVGGTSITHSKWKKGWPMIEIVFFDFSLERFKRHADDDEFFDGFYYEDEGEFEDDMNIILDANDPVYMNELREY